MCHWLLLNRALLHQVLAGFLSHHNKAQTIQVSQKTWHVITSTKSHLPVCGYLCVHVCVNNISASEVQWPGTDENPLGESLLDVPPTASPQPSFPPGSVTARGRRLGGTEPCEPGVITARPLCQPQTRNSDFTGDSL